VSRKLTVVDERAVGSEQVLLARADLLLLLSQLLASQQPLNGELFPLDTEPLTELLSAAEIGCEPELTELMLTAAQASREVTAEQWAAAHEDLFGPELTCPPYEAAFIRRDKGALLADIAGFYRAFGFAAKAGERPDHVCSELEFVALLHVSVARAQAEGSAEATAIAAEALGAFVADHLGDWLPAFARKLANAATLPLHVALARLLLQAAVALGCVMTAVDDELATDLSSSDSPYECGLAAAANPGGPDA
jgi:TorA maturation chaperone TorD